MLILIRNCWAGGVDTHCNPNTWKVEAGELAVHLISHLQLSQEFGPSLNYMWNVVSKLYQTTLLHTKQKQNKKSQPFSTLVVPFCILSSSSQRPSYFAYPSSIYYCLAYVFIYIYYCCCVCVCTCSCLPACVGMYSMCVCRHNAWAFLWMPEGQLCNISSLSTSVWLLRMGVRYLHCWAFLPVPSLLSPFSYLQLVVTH